jgi:hypothetical protein
MGSVFMRARDRKRAAGASAISLVLHGLFLAAMVAGLRVIPPPPEAPPIEIQLIPPIPVPVSQPAPTTGPVSAPRQAAPRPVLRPHVSPLPPAPLPPVIVPEAASPAPSAPVAAGPKGLLPSLTGRLGCDDPASFHLTDAQRAVCDQRLAEVAKSTKPLALNIAQEAKDDFDRKVRCHAASTKGAIPSLKGTFSHDDSTGQQIGGLGYNPSFRDCPPGDR